MEEQLGIQGIRGEFGVGWTVITFGFCGGMLRRMSSSPLLRRVGTHACAGAAVTVSLAVVYGDHTRWVGCHDESLVVVFLRIV